MTHSALKSQRLFVAMAFVVLGGLALPAQADDGSGLDSASSDALKKTQELLTDPTKRQEAVNANADSQKADQSVRDLAGSQANTNEVYGLSSDIFASMVQKSGGDSTAMQKMLEDASKNPEAFMNSMSPEQKQKLEEISKHISGNKQ